MTNKIKIPFNISEDLLSNKNYYSLKFFLILKPLFVSGHIHNVNGNYPYKKISELTGYSLRSVKTHIYKLIELKLVYHDKDKHLRLKRYTDLYNHVKGTDRRKRVKGALYPSTISISVIVHTETLSNNIRQQNLRIKQKVWLCYLKQRTGEINFDKLTDVKKIKLSNVNQPVTKSEFKIIRAEFLANYTEILKRYMISYKNALCSLQDGYPEFTPYTTLSYKGQGRLYGNKARSTAYYWFTQSEWSGLIKRTQSELRTANRQLEWERIMLNRKNVLHNKYHKRWKPVTHRNYLNLLQLSNILEILPPKFETCNSVT